MSSLKDFYETAQLVRSTLAYDWGQDIDLIPSVRALRTKYRKKGSCQAILKDIYDGMSEERKNFVDGSKLLTQLGRNGYSKSATHEILELFYSGATPQEITAKHKELHPACAKVKCVTMIHNAMKRDGHDASRADAIKFLDTMMNSVRTEDHQCGPDCSHNNGNAPDENSDEVSDETSTPVDKDNWYIALRKSHRDRLACQEQIKIDEAEHRAVSLKKKKEKMNKKRRRSREKKRNQSKKHRK
jgi:hypothetical protein